MNRKGFTLIELMIVIAIIGILAAIAIPNFRKAREQAREKACYANMRVILGAIEMYNMDNTSMMATLADTDATTSGGKLVSGKYLKSPVTRPEKSCSYSGAAMDGTGLIVCSIHGTVEGN
ncbi:MAG: prepilin-type N-terminal cleavage/methylation domain-containing protein [Candidatus Riflebacteria bacterium]|nr:prepilin-type N-terminal cleavage/methylation domain-containing protein [Candidatus Riflebacteria bacterium]